MKVRIEIDDDLEQTEVVIRTKQLSPEIETPFKVSYHSLTSHP